MYIKFDLHYQSLYDVLTSEVENWSQQTGISYTLKNHKMTVKMTVPSASDYTAFCLYWGTKEFHNDIPYTLIEPMKVDKS